MMTHGDDTLARAKREQIIWFRGEMLEKFESKASNISVNGTDNDKEESFTKREFRITRDGWEYEADQAC